MGKILLWILAALLGLCLLYVLFLAGCALRVATTKEYEHDSPFYRRLLYGATACCIRLLHIHIHVDGMEKLPKDAREKVLIFAQGMVAMAGEKKE